MKELKIKKFKPFRFDVDPLFLRLYIKRRSGLTAYRFSEGAEKDLRIPLTIIFVRDVIENLSKRNKK
jgi:hypothetical protein